MNRKEQILAAAKQQYARKGYTRDAFIAGALWADDNPLKSPWISIEEGLPERVDHEKFSIPVVARLDTMIVIAVYHYYEKVWITPNFIDDTEYIIDPPTHWMPIPKLSEV